MTDLLIWTWISLWYWLSIFLKVSYRIEKFHYHDNTTNKSQAELSMFFHPRDNSSLSSHHTLLKAPLTGLKCWSADAYKAFWLRGKIGIRRRSGKTSDFPKTQWRAIGLMEISLWRCYLLSDCRFQHLCGHFSRPLMLLLWAIIIACRTCTDNVWLDWIIDYFEGHKQ